MPQKRLESQQEFVKTVNNAVKANFDPDDPRKEI